MNVAGKQWAVFDLHSGVHVVPDDDLVEHDLDGSDCVCVPTLELAVNADSPDRWLIVHHSLDGRERFG